MKDVVLEPQEILALYASPNQVEKGETVMLGDIKSQNQVSNSVEFNSYDFGLALHSVDISSSTIVIDYLLAMNYVLETTCTCIVLQNIFIVVETTCPLAKSVEEDQDQPERQRSDSDLREFVEEEEEEEDHRRGRGAKGKSNTK